MKSIIISPWSRKTPKGEHCAKNYPFWPELITLLKQEGFHTIQIGKGEEEKLQCDDIFFNKPLIFLLDLLKRYNNWVAVDNFFPHFAHYYGFYGTVIFSKSNPKIFGYPENQNLLKNESFLRKDQFLFWDNEPLIKESFIEPEKVIQAIKKMQKP